MKDIVTGSQVSRRDGQVTSNLPSNMAEITAGDRDRLKLPAEMCEQSELFYYFANIWVSCIKCHCCGAEEQGERHQKCLTAACSRPALQEPALAAMLLSLVHLDEQSQHVKLLSALCLLGLCFHQMFSLG